MPLYAAVMVACGMVDRGGIDFSLETAACKVYGSELAFRTANEALQKIQRQIQWNRLIAVVEEQAQTMIRTAFSTTVREAGDLSAGIFDLQGRMLAQAVTGTPGHVNSMMESVGHFLAKFPAHIMQPGCSR